MQLEPARENSPERFPRHGGEGNGDPRTGNTGKELGKTTVLADERGVTREDKIEAKGEAIIRWKNKTMSQPVKDIFVGMLKDDLFNLLLDDYVDRHQDPPEYEI